MVSGQEGRTQGPVDGTCSDDELDTLYEALAAVGLQPKDVIKEIRREGKLIGHLGQLSSFEVQKLIRDCRKYMK